MSDNNKGRLARQVYREACEAGERALREAKPTPMIVSEADGLSDKPKAGGKSWYVPSGVCGFAWVKVRGNSWFIRAKRMPGRLLRFSLRMASMPMPVRGWIKMLLFMLLRWLFKEGL